jgi:hypothetical protein
MADQTRNDCIPRQNSDEVVVSHEKGMRRGEGTFIGRRGKSRLAAGRLVSIRHAAHAVMFAVTAAARRKVSFTPGREREEGGSERQAKDGHQRNGDELTQLPLLKHLPLDSAMRSRQRHG